MKQNKYFEKFTSNGAFLTGWENIFHKSED